MRALFKLAHEMASELRDDAISLDRLLGTTSFADSLAFGTVQSVTHSQSLDPSDYYSPDTLQLARAFAQLMARQIKADPKHFSWATRTSEFRSDRPAFGHNRPAIVKSFLSRLPLIS